MIMVKDTSASGPYTHTRPFSEVYRFKITLKDVEPPVWRRIEVPGDYSFWELHVALTDVFGWWDSHLHEFSILNPTTGKQDRLGIWNEDDSDVLMDWEFKIAGYFTKQKNRTAVHKYDFGDGWEHRIDLEDVYPPEAGVSYPRCLDGAMACPPEDVGGPPGYAAFVEAMRDPAHPAHESSMDWMGEDFDPEVFYPADIHFDDPDKRWGVAFNDEEMTPDMRMWEFSQEED